MPSLQLSTPPTGPQISTNPQSSQEIMCKVLSEETHCPMILKLADNIYPLIILSKDIVCYDIVLAQ